MCFFRMRFLDCTNGDKDPSKSVLDVGVENALIFSGFDEKMFLKRGGKYVWSKGDLRLDWWFTRYQWFLHVSTVFTLFDTKTYKIVNDWQE